MTQSFASKKRNTNEITEIDQLESTNASLQNQILGSHFVNIGSPKSQRGNNKCAPYPNSDNFKKTPVINNRKNEIRKQSKPKLEISKLSDENVAPAFNRIDNRVVKTDNRRKHLKAISPNNKSRIVMSSTHSF